MFSHDIYRWTPGNTRGVRPRASSYAGTEAAPDSAFQHIHEPGGFRRNYLLRRANEQGTDRPRILNNFIDFLYIFGHFVSTAQTR
jgi:solute carrier family 36 (proton-coupled amino acid transporter)